MSDHVSGQNDTFNRHPKFDLHASSFFLTNEPEGDRTREQTDTRHFAQQKA